MRLRSPAEFYLKYLIVHPDGLSTPAIKERLIDEGLDFISEEYLDRLRLNLVPPSPFYPDDRNHAASMAFILRERINRLFQRDITMKMALELLHMPRAREFAESMLLIQVPLSAIAAFISRHRGVYCTPDALELYSHYFWNINLLDSTQMRVLAMLRIDLAAQNIPEFKDHKDVLKTAYYKSALRAAVDLPHSPTTAMIVQQRLGVKPSRSDLALRMMEARDTAIMRAVEATQQDGLHDSQKFLNYATGSRILEELLQMVVKPEEEMREQLQSIALRTDPNQLTPIHQLSGGQHTVDVSPQKDPDHDESSESHSATGDFHSGG